MGFCQHLLRNAAGRLAYRPGLDDAGFAEWRQRVRDKLADLLALTPELIAPGPAPDPPPVRLSTERRDGYRLEKWEAYPEPGSVVPLLMLVLQEIGWIGGSAVDTGGVEIKTAEVKVDGVAEALAVTKAAR